MQAKSALILGLLVASLTPINLLSDLETSEYIVQTQDPQPPIISPPPQFEPRFSANPPFNQPPRLSAEAQSCLRTMQTVKIKLTGLVGQFNGCKKQLASCEDDRRSFSADFDSLKEQNAKLKENLVQCISAAHDQFAKSPIPVPPSVKDALVQNAQVDLSAQVEQLRQDNQRLFQDNVALKRAEEGYKSAIKCLENDKTALLDQIAKLGAKSSADKASSGPQTDDCQESRAANAKLVEDNKRLFSDNRQLNEQNRWLQARLKGSPAAPAAGSQGEFEELQQLLKTANDKVGLLEANQLNLDKFRDQAREFRGIVALLEKRTQELEADKNFCLDQLQRKTSINGGRLINSDAKLPGLNKLFAAQPPARPSMQPGFRATDPPSYPFANASQQSDQQTFIGISTVSDIE